MRNDFAKTNQPQFTSRRLKNSDIPTIINFQNDVMSRIKVQDKTHIPAPRSKEYLIKHLNEGMPIAALLDKEKLVGYCLITFPDNNQAENIADYVIDDPQNTVILQFLLLDPAYLKHDIFTKIYDYAIDICADLERKTVVVNTAHTNHRVLTGLDRMGFKIYADRLNSQQRPTYTLKKELF